MQTPGRPTPRTLVLTITATLAFAQAAQAQESVSPDTHADQPGVDASQPELTPEQEALAEDFYRAEVVILQRKVEPSEVDERMARKLPEPPDLGAEAVLRHTTESGETLTTLELVPQQELHLSTAAQRLENSGRFRVLLAEGWYQAFPPDFKGTPLWVSAGDWLPDAKHTNVQGMITIDRQRYLHVNVNLNHWLPASPKDNLLDIDLTAETPNGPRPPRIAIQPAIDEEEASEQDRTASAEQDNTAATTETAVNGPAETEDRLAPAAESGRELIAGLNWPRADLLTWIQETRRMRSEEVHYLDSPTLGVLVFFKKIEPEDAAPLILELGLTGETEEGLQEAP